MIYWHIFKTSDINNIKKWLLEIVTIFLLTTMDEPAG